MHLLQFELFEESVRREGCGVLVLPFWKEERSVGAASRFKDSSSDTKEVLNFGDFEGKEGETYLFYQKGKGKKREHRTIFLGLGKEDEVSVEQIRKAFASLTHFVRKMKFERVQIALPVHPKFKSPLIARGVVEGMLLSNYSFDALKGESKKETLPLVKKATLLGADRRIGPLCKKWCTIAHAVYYARDLIMGNADDVTPEFLGKKALELQHSHKTIKTHLFSRKEIREKGMGLLDAVSKGANPEPRFILVEYRGAPKSKEWRALVGKGITFDTGGLNLKPTGGIETMRDDMSGGAAVLGTLRAAAALKLPLNIVGAIPSTENAIGSKSYKPGDVHRSYSGITVEITNTDAEGRLVLADALSYIQDHYQLKEIVDIATLTGAASIALGDEASVLFSNDDLLAKQLETAGEATYERVWRMPLFPEYRELLKSSVADLKNSAGRPGSLPASACFLHRFIQNGRSWAHLDIGGTAFLTQPRHYHTANATGVGVRLLIEFLEQLS